MNLDDRVANYSKSIEGQRYPDSIPRISASGRWIDGTWILGQNYQAKSSLYGSYPPKYVERVLELCPEGITGKVLHCFSGSIPAGPWVRLDLVADRKPDLLGDATFLPFLASSFDLVLADPPYSSSDAEKYGTKMPNRRKVLAELARITKKDGTLVWLDTQLPMFAKRDWHWWGAISIIRSSNHRIRLASFFSRT